MIGTDSNVLLRFLAGDSARQSPIAGALVSVAGKKGDAIFVVDVYAESTAGFADGLIVAKNVETGCATTHTFDRKLGNVPGTSLLA